MRIGIFGGSFDPVHFGHLLLAEWAREQAELDEVWLMPAYLAPHKTSGPRTSSEHRVAMLELATADNPTLHVCRLELEREGVSYTVDTLQSIRKERPADELFLLMGADSLADLPNWRAPSEICSLATPLVARRFGSDQLDFSILSEFATPAVQQLAESMQLLMPVVDFSSTELRSRVQTEASLRYQTPAAVIDYITTHGLYR